eukprot:gene23537-30518_t
MYFKLFSCFYILSIFVIVKSYDSNYNVTKSLRYVAFCGVAYCTNPVFKVDTVETWTCNACKSFSNVTANSFHGYLSDGNGFIAYDFDENEIIISFSGTDPLSIRNWIDDLDFIKTDYPLCDGCKVHRGFYNTYLTVADDVRSLLSEYVNAFPSATISITGHSLGAALAAHCAGDLYSLGYNFTTLYTYGMPRVGNKAYELWYTSVISGTFRQVHHKDPVPHVPPESWQFHHMPYEVFYERDYNSYTICSVEGEDSKCSDQYLADLDVANHLNYLDFDFTTNWLSCEI